MNELCFAREYGIRILSDDAEIMFYGEGVKQASMASRSSISLSMGSLVFWRRVTRVRRARHTCCKFIVERISLRDPIKDVMD